MRILVLGGTVFLSRAVAAEALARGHDVVCAHRGVSGTPPEGATSEIWDRADGAPPPAALSGTAYDAVVDVARHPSRVRTAVAAWPGAHWTFVSTVNVYADEATPGQTPATGGLLPPEPDDVDPTTSPQAYGAMKVACEEIVRAGASSSFVVRPGLIVGPGDPTGRFTYWPWRLAATATDPAHHEVLAPGDPSDVVQVVDVRDLATWILDAAESGLTGTYDGVGEPSPIGDLLGALAAGLAPEVRLTWVSSATLTDLGVEPWSGDDAIPLWLPRPAYDGMLAHDPGPSLAAGLRLRPVTESAADVLADKAALAARTGIGLAREAELLAAADRD